MRMLKMSKVTTFLVGLMMMAIFLSCSSQVQAAPGDFTYTVKAGKAQLTRYNGAGGAVTIPNSTLDGYPVTSIGDAAFIYCSGLTSISIPEGVTSIGDYAFGSCTGLTSISLPQSVISIGTEAFESCTDLTSISLPQSVTSIGNYAFAGCTGLTSISIPQGVTSIGDAVFFNCTGLTSITIPQEVTSIGDGAFSGCTGLTSIDIPQGVTSIGSDACYKCTGLNSIKFNSATTAIYNDIDTIPVTTTIIGYDPSTAKTYAAKYDRNFTSLGPSPALLQSIAITTPATKLSYIVGDTLDITGLVITGTYSDGSTKVELITAANITGFNSAVAATDQVLTITVGAKTTTYKVQIVSAPISVTGVSLNKSTTSMNIGANETLTATISPSNATNKSVTWSSSDSSVASVDSTGLVTALNAGFTTITVSTVDGNKVAYCDVTVTEPPKTVQSLSVNPSTLNLTIDQQSDPIILTATYTDNTTEDVTASATWTSSNIGIATVDVEDDSVTVTGVANGFATIMGSYGCKTGTLTVKVAPQIDSILVQPESVSVIYGKTKAVKIYTVYSDNTKKDVTSSVTLESDDESIATVTGGIIKGISVGETVVLGTYLGQDIEIPVTVTPPVTKLTADPSSLNLNVEGTETITLTATYKDGTEDDVTESATWTSKKPSIATVDEYGTVTGVAIGSTTITATYGGKTATIAVTVVPELDSILVQPRSVGVAKGKTQVVTIYAVYADGSTADITKSIRLTSDDTTVATVTGATIKGIAADCDTTVTGTYLGQDIEIPVKVTQPLKTLISDTGTFGLNLSIDESETITLTATYADGSSEEVNDCATGVSSKPSVATVDIADGSITVTGVATGSATITLNYEGKKVTVKVKVTA